ncbi:hypothetical protein Bca4012_054760 [Brassica carinata]
MVSCSNNILVYTFIFLLATGNTIAFSSSSLPHTQDPNLVVDEVINRSVRNASRRSLAYLSCRTGNPIDDCWRCDPNWETNRQRLADCAIGFGKHAIGGRGGRIQSRLIARASGAVEQVNPRPGALRHAVTQAEPLWIIFKRDMVIRLKKELIITSFKTIDGRGASVHITDRLCIKIHYATNIIIHGINIHDCKPRSAGMIRDGPRYTGWWVPSDGEAVAIFGGKHMWIDHCSFSNCEDGLIDAIHGSTAITISNNHMTHHDKLKDNDGEATDNKYYLLKFSQRQGAIVDAPGDDPIDSPESFQKPSSGSTPETEEKNCDDVSGKIGSGTVEVWGSRLWKK